MEKYRAITLNPGSGKGKNHSSKGASHSSKGKNHSFKGRSLATPLNPEAFQVKCRDLPIIPGTIVEKFGAIPLNPGSAKGKNHSSKGANHSFKGKNHSFKGKNLVITLNPETFQEKSRDLPIIPGTIVEKCRAITLNPGSGKGKNDSSKGKNHSLMGKNHPGHTKSSFLYLIFATIHASSEYSHMIRLTLFVFILLFLASCNPSVYRTYKDDKTDDSNPCGLVVVRFYIPDSVATKIGEIFIDDVGASVNCSEEQTLHYLKNEGCSVGAQIISIRDVKRPDDESYCYRCTALLYKYKPGAKPIKANKYFDMVNIKKREQKDRKYQIKRTIGITETIRHIIYILTFRHYENRGAYPFL